MSKLHWNKIEESGLRNIQNQVCIKTPAYGFNCLISGWYFFVTAGFAAPKVVLQLTTFAAKGGAVVAARCGIAGITELVKKVYESQGMSEEKKKFLSDQFKKLITEEKKSRAPIPEEANRMFEEIFAEKVPEDEWPFVRKVLKHLDDWKYDLEESAKSLQDVNRKFQELLQT